MSEKLTFKKIVDVYLPIAVVFGGTALLIYGTLLQTECFHLEYVKWTSCVMAFFIGFFLGFILMRYMKNHTYGNYEGARKTRPQDVVVMTRGYLFSFALCAFLLMRAITVSFLLVSIAGMTMAIVSLAYYLIWLYKDTKAQESLEK